MSYPQTDLFLAAADVPDAVVLHLATQQQRAVL